MSLECLASKFWNFHTTYTSLPENFYTYQNPKKWDNPKLIQVNLDLAHKLHLKLEQISKEDLAQIFSGHLLPNETRPFAQAYAGHQFGYLNLLGDGRALLLGEHCVGSSDRFDIHLKGSGPTKYSRSGDGQATLGPMLREYIISEALHHLNIPTTRSLAVLQTGQSVQREKLHPGALLTRVAQSHLRVGTFEFAALNNDISILEKLFHYAQQRHYPSAQKSKNKVFEFLKLVGHRQINLVVHWMRVGFIHGVMNTDNTTISGEGIDYGPCAFLEEYNPNQVYSAIDTHGRYRFSQQGRILIWNLACLCQTLLPLLGASEKESLELAKVLLQEFEETFEKNYHEMMKAKIGLFGEQEADRRLIQDLLNFMQKIGADYTNSFHQLLPLLEESLIEENLEQYYQVCQIKDVEKALFQKNLTQRHREEFLNWQVRWRQRIKQNERPLSKSVQEMRKNNPVIIPRNHLVEEVLKNAYEQNFEPLEKYLDVLKTPYEDREMLTAYKKPAGRDEKITQTFCGT